MFLENAKRSKSEASLAPWKSSGLALAPIRIGDLSIMTHRERLSPWIIVRLLPSLQRIVVGRFRNWSDADGHLRILQQLIPTGEFIIAFDPPKEISEGALNNSRGGMLSDRM
jgi:hypothetical protein